MQFSTTYFYLMSLCSGSNLISFLNIFNKSVYYMLYYHQWLLLMTSIRTHKRMIAKLENKIVV